VAAQTVELARRLQAPRPPADRARLERRARLLSWGGNAWHLVEFAVAAGAGNAVGSVSLVGFRRGRIGLAAVTAPSMPLLARAKRKVAREPGSAATTSEAGQNMLCAHLSVAAARGPPRERPRRVVVGRSGGCARDRGTRGEGRPRHLARRRLRLLLSRRPASIPPWPSSASTTS
jgi:hypothetical protein